MRQAAMLAQERGLSALTRQILFRLEHGQIKTPDSGVLRAVADLYKLPYDDLVTRWTRAHFYGDDKSDTPHTESGVSQQPHTEVVLTAEAEDRELLPVPNREPYAETHVVPTAEAFERVVGELAALVRQLPRGLASVDRADGPGLAPRPGRNRTKHGRKHPEKPARE